MNVEKIGPYRICRVLGKGGMGVVLEAVHEQIGRRAAIKVLHAQLARDQGLVRRFLNEARSVNVVRHPGLVEVFDYGTMEDGAPYLVMEYLDGQCLFDRVAAQAPMPERAVWALCWQMATALAAAHEKGIVHRDLKPENVMIVKDPLAPDGERVKILDFGIAKLRLAAGLYDTAGARAEGEHDKEDDERPTQLEGLSERATQLQGSGGKRSSPGLSARRSHRAVSSGEGRSTRAGESLGTREFMAPEQYLGAAEVTGSADVFSLGVILHEALTGQVPFKPFEVLDKDAVPLRSITPSVSEETAALVDRMLTREPAQRPSMEEVATLVAGWLLPKTPPPSLPIPAPAPRRLWPALLAGLAVLTLAIAAPLLWLRRPSLDPPPYPGGLPALRAEARRIAQEGLRAPQGELRRAAAQALANAPDARPTAALLPLLQDPEPRVQEAATTTLGRLNDASAAAPLRGLLSRDAPSVQVAAAGALEQLGDAEGGRWLRQALRNPNVLLGAARWLSARGDEEARRLLTTMLTAMLTRGLPEAETLPLQIDLAQAGDKGAQQALRARLSAESGDDQGGASAQADERRARRLMAAAGLSRLGDEQGRAALREAAGRSGPGQLLALRLLASQGEAPRRELLRQVALGQGSAPPASRVVAVDALGECGDSDDALRLAGLLRAADPGLRLAAAEAVLRLTSGAALSTQAIEWAQGELTTDSAAARAVAADLLADAGPAAQPAAQLLAQRLRDDGAAVVRRAAARALGAVGGASVLGPLQKALTDPDGGVRREALRALARLASLPGAASVELREQLLHLAQRGAPLEQVMAQATLLRLGDSAQRAALQTALQSDDPAVRRAAASALPTELLGAALADADPEVQREAAARLLGQDPRALGVLRAAIERGGVPAVDAFARLRRDGAVPSEVPAAVLAALLTAPSADERRRAVAALAGLPSAEAIPLLRRALADTQVVVRAQAAVLLTRLGAASAPPLEARRPAAQERPRPAPAVAPDLGERADAAQASAAPDLGEAEDSAAQTAEPKPSAPEAHRAPPPTETVAQLGHLADEGRRALLRGDLPTAQSRLERAASKCGQDRAACGALGFTITLDLARVYEQGNKVSQAMSEYERLQRLRPTASQAREAAAARAAARRLSTQFGRVLLHTLDKRGRCTTSTLWLEPGNQIISMKNGQTRTVSVTAGGTTDLEGCQ